MATRAVVISTGVGLATGSVPWNTSEAKRSAKPHLPKAQEKFLNADGTVSRNWYQALQWVFNEALGGLDAPTLPQVVATVTKTQAQVVESTNFVDQAVQFTRSVASTAIATAQVAQNAGLSGSSSIPPPSDAPTRPNTQLD